MAKGVSMNRRAYGLIAGLIGAGVAGWLWRKKMGGRMQPVRDRGTVIFDNTPRASESDVPL
jgi:hypothetical protein